MRPVVRLGDLCSGHGCFPPRNAIAGSPNVFVNNLPLNGVGDLWNVHLCGPVAHAGVSASGSPTVFVNGKPVCRVGDLIDCGSIMAAGSPNVFQS